MESLDAAIKESCPNGIDMFFDNVKPKILHVSFYSLFLFSCGCGVVYVVITVSNASVLIYWLGYFKYFFYIKTQKLKK